MSLNEAWLDVFESFITTSSGRYTETVLTPTLYLSARPVPCLWFFHNQLSIGMIFGIAHRSQGNRPQPARAIAPRITHIPVYLTRLPDTGSLPPSLPSFTGAPGKGPVTRPL
ncbi:MAG TPA: hypothetical protein VF885_20260 [Arthrobacter sp.]